MSDQNAFRPFRTFLGLAAALGLLLAGPAARAQVTTGSLSGLIEDESGGVVPGATVEAVHEPTGTRYTAVSGNEGLFLLLNIRVGGPYSVTATLSGFKPGRSSVDRRGLGGQTAVDLQPQGGDRDARRSRSWPRAPPCSTPSATARPPTSAQEAIQTLPTVGRGIDDFARLSPYFTSMASGEDSGATALSVAGRNNRYNNIQIDGAVNNDLFGLAASGAPGGQTDTPAHLASTRSRSCSSWSRPTTCARAGSPAGGMNAITRSGTNEFHGTVY